MYPWVVVRLALLHKLWQNGVVTAVGCKRMIGREVGSSLALSSKNAGTRHDIAGHGLQSTAFGHADLPTWLPQTTDLPTSGQPFKPIDEG